MDPAPEYVAKIGTLAYLVAQLEWLIIDDIRLASTSVDAMDLHDKPTGAIGRALERVVPELIDRPNVQHFVATAAKALLNVAARRNTVLHARPASRRSGDVWLLKLSVDQAGEVDSTWIDDAYLDRQISAVKYWLRRVDGARGLPLD